jgi:phosphoribosyl 1,2-cyclic phosphodiesterase
MLRLLKSRRIQRIDAVLLTHPHADAILGLDDIREWIFGDCTSVAVYARDIDMPELARVFPYLVDRYIMLGGRPGPH